MAILLWVAFAGANQPAGWPEYGGSHATRIIGWCLLIGGGVPFAVALLFGLGLRRSHGLRVDELRQTGLYSVSRNPQVLGFFTAMLGYWILWPSARNAGAVVLIAVATHWMIRTEEEHLSDRFGQRYERYRERVPRYLAVGRLRGGGRG